MSTPDHAARLAHRRDLARSRRDDLRLCLRYCVSEGVVAMPIVTMALSGSLFLSALVTKAFPLSSSAIGFMGALPFVGNFLQIFFVPLILRRAPAKSVAVAAALLHLASWVALGLLLPRIPRGNPTQAALWLVAWYLTSSLFGAVAGVGWSTWIEQWVPARIRGKFFGRRNRVLQSSTVVFLVASGWALSAGDYSVRAFQAVIFGAAFLRLFSLRWQWISPTRPHRPPPPPRGTLGGQVDVLLADRSFLVFVAFGAVWSFAANCFGPFYTVFMLDRVGFSAFDVGAVTALAQVGGALSLPAWGRLLDKHGCKSVMVFSLILWQASMFGWCLLGPGSRLALYFLWTWIGATSAGFVLGNFMIGLRLIPLEAKSLAIGFNLAMASLVAAVAPVMGGWVLSHLQALWDDPVRAYHACFLAQPVVALLGAFLLLRVREPQASPFSRVVGAMRNVRTLGGVLGLSFLVNHVFTDESSSEGHPR